MESGFSGRIYAMGPRVPAVRTRNLMRTTSSTLGFRVPAPVLVARAEETTECTDARLCEKPVGSSSMTIPIVLGIGIPLVLAVSVLIFLHRRNLRKQRLEDLNDPHKSLDFGLDQGGKASQKSLIGREKDSQSRFNRQQMSMDMNLSSPYLLPPEAHNSQESLNSLARTLKQTEDPYRRVAQYPASEVGSIRSFPKGQDAASVYTRSSSRQDIPSVSSPGAYQPGRQDSLPRSPLYPPEPSHMKPEQPLPEEMPAPLNFPFRESSSAESTDSASPRLQDANVVAIATIQEPPAVAQRASSKPLPSHSLSIPGDSSTPSENTSTGNPFEKPEAQEVETPTESSPVGLGLMGQSQHGPSRVSVRSSTSSYNSGPASPAAQRAHLAPGTAPIIEEPHDYYDYVDMSEQPRSPSPDNRNGQLDVEEPRGRNMQRTSHLYEQQDGAQAGLGVPQQDNRRLSVGFRPLPPDEIMESEDPEYRANRIRSFYKEYFEDSKPENMPPVPPMPSMASIQQNQQRPPPSQQRQQQQGTTDYYEDYDANYAQDAPYFDPASNSFVMPYAQPVSRRAMTPPPSGQRFPGPRGPPRAFHGSQAGMGLPPNVRGPPRPGSSVSNQRGPHSRPGSSMSSAYGRPRAGSAMSGSRLGPRKPIPPPADLPTLPTPSKLTDDSFAIFNAIDFAPPESFSERSRGRSQSPAGERRPYKLNVPVHSPLVNAFEELSVLPSPHVLRKSSTFTGLDFAPPRKFTDSDARSDAGSIRSNRSGISQAQLSAIRSGAGRVSRLPGDQVFTQAALNSTLKPQWGMRD
ncbi:hypothetical protein MMYC01_205409 [Madurella mycetomatis]|uniref:Uncharacterized protein n=1 Tax=Madurella mycetomatis TaxID=100816 RepID=A0A175W324_9PEZI|nr:hypothetical protein MMYC01_205409 [Madurella mycetomatis]